MEALPPRVGVDPSTLRAGQPGEIDDDGNTHLAAYDTEGRKLGAEMPERDVRSGFPNPDHRPDIIHFASVAFAAIRRVCTSLGSEVDDLRGVRSSRTGRLTSMRERHAECGVPGL